MLSDLRLHVQYYWWDGYYLTIANTQHPTPNSTITTKKCSVRTMLSALHSDSEPDMDAIVYNSTSPPRATLLALL